MRWCHIRGNASELGSKLTGSRSFHVHQGSLKLLVDCHFLLLVGPSGVRRHRAIQRLLGVLVFILKIRVEVWFISSSKQVCLSIPIRQLILILFKLLQRSIKPINFGVEASDNTSADPLETIWWELAVWDFDDLFNLL